MPSLPISLSSFWKFSLEKTASFQSHTYLEDPLFIKLRKGTTTILVSQRQWIVLHIKPLSLNEEVHWWIPSQRNWRSWMWFVKTYRCSYSEYNILETLSTDSETLLSSAKQSTHSFNSALHFAGCQKDFNYRLDSLYLLK